MASGWAAEDPSVHHALEVVLDPTAHEIHGRDTLTLPPAAGNQVEFLLHAGLTVSSPDATLRAVGPVSTANSPVDGRAPVRMYRTELASGRSTLTLDFHGRIHHPIAEGSDEYARSAYETPGLIGAEGVFLAGSSLWYPSIPSPRMTFELKVTAPTGWVSVSQGKRTHHLVSADTVTSTWEERAPQEEIYLIANRFAEYAQAAGAAEAMVFLRQPEPALAQKYLDATGQYFEMYRSLIGPYPYAKFALVENFWETGYGMPSFTLLGPKVVRLPFIIASSYPHEILHNWWGNGVYVDYSRGNWAEGLTSYLADHLLREQQGEGAAFRRSVLQNYTDFVSNAKDFPLTEFRARHSSSSEAIGYGKTQLLFHMLRRTLGDAVFVKALHQFYAKHKFKPASFADVENAFAGASGTDLSAFFEQWVERVGAPQLRIRDVSVIAEGPQFQVRGTLEQVQNGPPYALEVPIAITLAGHEHAIERKVALRAQQTAFHLEVPAKPLRVDVDPQFDLFRRLDRAEIPPALSQAFGADRALLVLPAGAGEALLAAYREFAASWQRTQLDGLDIVLDRDVAALPTDRTVWLLGWENTFVPALGDALREYDVQVSDKKVQWPDNRYGSTEDSVVLVGRNPAQPRYALAWVATANINAVAGLANKLPHYRKYSYLVFNGDEPTNSAKGQWPVVRSPLTVTIDGAARAATPKFADRPALAQLPALFSEPRMMDHVRALAAPDKEGRGPGSRGIDEAADYIANEFRAAGLQPGAESDQTYLQVWTEFVPELQREVVMKNVIGVLPGRNAALAGQSVVISAHYDHLGLGNGPGVRSEHQGQVHPGADDNASGVAVMLELARLAAQTWQPERTVVFVAFTGEELQQLGSRYYVRNYARFPAAKAIGALNLDTVGRLGQAPLIVFGSGSAKEWVHIFRGAQFVTGVEVKPAATDFGASDQRSFLDIGIPAVQLFGTVHPDFHSPGDTVEHVDSAGLVKVAMVLKEAAEYLAGRGEPLTASTSAASALSNNAGSTPSARQVSLGTVPEYAYPGPGVRLSDVVAESPAARAGLQSGDILTTLNGRPITDLSGLSQILRDLQVGESITLVYQRGGRDHAVQLETAAR